MYLPRCAHRQHVQADSSWHCLASSGINAGSQVSSRDMTSLNDLLPVSIVCCGGLCLRGPSVTGLEHFDCTLGIVLRNWPS